MTSYTQTKQKRKTKGIAMKKEKEIPEFTGSIQAQFNPQELTAIAQIIDLATRRGLFSAADLTGVATIYNKIVSYLPKGAQQ